MEHLLQLAQQWQARDFDPQTIAALQALIDAQDWSAIADCCGQRLAFGTAGLRGVMGPGPNRINRLVMRETCQGICATLLQLQQLGDEPLMLIGYDGRLQSKIFAEDCAAIALHNGFTIQLFDEPVPTPLLAFAMQHLHAVAGIMITASHNPPSYNGVKLFWHNGAQIVPPIDAQCMQAIAKVAQSPLPQVEFSRSHPKLRGLGLQMGQSYVQAVQRCLPVGKQLSRQQLRIAYSPLHGVAGKLSQQLLQTAGFAPCQVVASQQQIDGTFPTLPFPNPEEPGVMTEVCQLAARIGADTAVAHDPDGDRLCVALPNEQGDWQVLSGDMLGILLAYALLERTAPSLRRQTALGTTIVSSRMLRALAASYGTHYFETLTGFKWLIAASLAQQAQHRQVLLTYEEALGYAVTPVVRDKDGLSALLVWADFVATCKQSGQTPWQHLLTLYKQLGYWFTGQQTIALRGQDGATWMAKLRQQGANVPGLTIEHMVDLLDPTTAQQQQLPTSDVLLYLLPDQSRIIVRPSGTEPKLKCYYEINLQPSTVGSFATIYQQAQKRLQQLQQDHRQSMVL